MNANEIIAELRSISSDKYKANVTKLGIPMEHSLGVSTSDIRALARTTKKSNELAEQLWNTGLHEAKILSLFIIDKKTFDPSRIDRMMENVYSWDLCDYLCKNLIFKLNVCDTYIHKWHSHPSTYYKRAAYTLMATAVIHDDTISPDKLDEYLHMIRTYSNDDRDHVKKSISWALREIGKKSFDYQDKALLIAYELKESKHKSQIWIAKDALKELEKLVQVEGRGRLISSDSKMGME